MEIYKFQTTSVNICQIINNMIMRGFLREQSWWSVINYYAKNKHDLYTGLFVAAGGVSSIKNVYPTFTV